MTGKEKRLAAKPVQDVPAAGAGASDVAVAERGTSVPFIWKVVLTVSQPWTRSILTVAYSAPP
jgi:hypothetical protein